jgi:predicted RNase H-like HicB family nuclease
MEKYLVVVQKASGNYGAYSPDVLGCVAVGDTVEETLTSYQEALAFHFEGMAEDGDELPEPKGIQHWLNEGEISDSDILAFVDVEMPALA